LYLGTSFALYFLTQYVAFVQLQQHTRKLDGPLHLARLGFWICLICAACLFMSLYAGLDLTLWPGRAIGIATLLLVVDALIRAGVAAFQARAKRTDGIPLGGSLVLETLFRSGDPWSAVVHHVETAFGVNVSDHWASGFLHESIEPLILVAIILFWLSTCFTAVPTESHGVRVYWGRYVEPALEPGLYVTWPWPAEKIEIVPTERVEQISLGFEYDLGGPALWTEVHYEGEKNLLVGNGEELLSISIPIYYRIKDPIEYLKTTTDAREALISLAYRQLLRVTEARDSFRVMTVERQEISRALQQSLQDEIDRLHLGLEIVFVGLKDIHPPVAVAAAFQDVVSAEEQKSALIYQAEAYRVQTVVEAKQQAYRLQTEAEAALAQRTALAEGEAARFLLLAPEDAAESNLFRIRFRLEALEKALAIPAKVLITGPAARNNQFYLDLRSLDTPLPSERD
jgi:regulator of protease activity HflC (stomatin/prohibitin superfamily)